MQSSDPRVVLLRALLLDWLGQLVIVGLIVIQREGMPFMLEMSQLEAQGPWLVFCFLLYPLLGWLFGSFTVLRWRNLSILVLIQRLLITSVAFLLTVAIVRWFLNPPLELWLVHRSVQTVWVGNLFVWSLLVRLGLRRGVLTPEMPSLLLLAGEDELSALMQAWRRVPQRDQLHYVTPDQLLKALDFPQKPLLVTVSPKMQGNRSLQALFERLETQDPRQVRVFSSLTLFAQQQERFPPFLMPESRLSYDDLPWASPFSIQAQLKRAADLLVAGVLLVLASPFVVLAVLLIWLEDRGPVFYVQERSGLMGQPFRVFKLRTMVVQPNDVAATWTVVGDQRITRVGHWLRRLRIDELPQLFNVLSGEMSLIGPRPERPELEHELEQAIPHYRKRHWMRPGLSGWAQVCAPYASSIEDSDLKLSYDLYYLMHFSTWLDLVIMFRTVKTVLKAGGR